MSKKIRSKKSISTKNKLFFSKKTVILLAFAAFIVFLLAYFYVFTTKKNNNFSVKQQVPEPWHKFTNSRLGLEMLLPPGMDPMVNNERASGAIPATGSENYAWLEWDLGKEPYILAQMFLQSKTKDQSESLENYVIRTFRIKDRIIPPSGEAYDLASDTTFDVIEFKKYMINNRDAVYLSIVPRDEDNDGYNNRFMSSEYVYIAKNDTEIIVLSASTEYNFDPYTPLLLKVADTISFK